MSLLEETRLQKTKRQTRSRLAFIRRLDRFSFDDFFEASSAIFAGVIVVIIVATSVLFVRGSIPVLHSFGTGFFTGTNWISVAGSESYGVLPYVLGTLVTSAIAVAVGVPLSLGIAIFLAEMAPLSLRNALSRVIEL